MEKSRTIFVITEEGWTSDGYELESAYNKMHSAFARYEEAVRALKLLREELKEDRDLETYPLHRGDRTICGYAWENRDDYPQWGCTISIEEVPFVG